VAGACSIAAAATLTLTRYVTRIVQRTLCARGINRRGCALVGVTDVGLQLAQSIQQSPELGMEVIGFYDDRPEARTADLPTELGARLGNIDELVEQTRSGKIQTIYITLPMRAEKRIRDVLDRLSDSTATVYFVPDFFVFQLLHARWSNIQGLPVVSIFENPFYGVDGIVKHALDFLLACCLIVALSPLLLAIALAVKLTSSGPVFFRQRRYGMDGREILVWKFRSMRVCEDGDRVVQATQGDARLTPIGGFLRKSSLDELPQLFNVVAGQMSLVGPRPHANAHNELYRKQIQGYMLRHKVRPGITGLAQVNGWRGETDTLEKMEKRIACDHQYIREWTLWLDLKILVRTISVVFSRKNAY
jgi:putative colanic acid biosynthesis UDP-glucose lipid carrier transferase